MVQRLFGIHSLAGVVLVGLVGSWTPATAADVAAQASRSAKLFVEEALHSEVFGLQQDRDRLLDAALQQDPDYGPARWHQGFVKYRGDWIRVDSVPQLIAEIPALEQYQQQRQKCANDLAGNLQMANWCRQHHLAAQERAHLSRVLDFAPDHANVRTRLRVPSTKR